MKLFFFTLFLSSFLNVSAETWLEVIEKSRETNEELKFFEEIKKKDSGLYRGAIRNQRLIEKALRSKPANFEQRSPLGEDVSTLTELYFSQRGLIKFYAASDQWPLIPPLLDTMQSFRNRIWKSHPSLFEFMISSMNSIIICDLLEELQEHPPLEKRRDLFDQLHLRWVESRVSRKDFQVVENGELLYAQEMCLDLKKWIKAFSNEFGTNLFPIPDHLAGEIETAELLSPSYDPQLSLKQSTQSLKKDFAWIKSGLPKTEHPDYGLVLPKRDLKYYHSHPNGLYEIISDATPWTTTPQLIEFREERDLEQLLLWTWLKNERNGKKLITRELLLAKLSDPEKRKLRSLKITFDFNSRLISRPKIEDRKYDEAKTIEVPNIFSN